MRATATAASRSAAPSTVIASSLVAPSPPRAISMGERLADRAQRFVERRDADPVVRGQLWAARRAVGEDEDRVARRGVPIDADHVEAAVDRILQPVLQQPGLDVGVGGEVGEHRGVPLAGGVHVGMDHARPLCAAAQRVGRAARLEGGQRLLHEAVGRQDRAREVAAALGREGDFGRARPHPIHGQEVPDDARAADEGQIDRAAGALRRQGEHRAGVGEALRPGRAVRVAGVDDHRLDVRVAQLLLVDEQGLGLGLATGEHRGGGGGPVGDEQRQVGLAGGLDPASDAARAVARGRRDGVDRRSRGIGHAGSWLGGTGWCVGLRSRARDRRRPR